jgi:O-antigen/teichoic acid export membrane protein
MGIYYLAYTMIEVAVSMTVSGFNAGTLMFASRYADNSEKTDRLYLVLANAFVISLIISGVLILLAHVGGPELILARYPQANLLESVQLLSWSLPFIVVPIIVIAATKARLTMKWDAILLGFVRPILLIGFALVGYGLDYGLTGLAAGYLITQVVLTILSLFVFGKYFSYRALFSHLRRFRYFRELLTFAIPQNLNMTFNTLITNLDVIMLGFFGYPPQVLIFYGMGAQVVRNIRQVKLALSSSFAPVIARLHGQKRLSELNEYFSMVTRWITTVGLPLGLIVALLKEDLLLLFHSTFTGDSTFMLLLLIPPLLSCCFGLAGNIVVMTGHSKWNLFNSLTVAGLNVALNYFLIPPFGMMGAATATVLASAAITLLQLVEVRYLIGARLKPTYIYKPYLAMVLPGALALASIALLGLGESLWARIGISVVCVAVFVVILFALGIDPRDKAAIAFWAPSKLAKEKGASS